MCGILGFVGRNSASNRDLIQRLMVELSLRGTHATGISVVTPTGIKTVSMPVGAEEFFKRTSLHSLSTPSIRLIGHTRYSTTGDLAWNQPLFNARVAVVVNGVIDQRGPDHWPTQFGPYRTTNDAEIALNAATRCQCGEFGGSWAVCEIDGASVNAYRNGYRPLWFGSTIDAIVCSSTVDSLLRCGISNPVKLPVGAMLDLVLGEVTPAAIGLVNPRDRQPDPINNPQPDLQCHV